MLDQNGVDNHPDPETDLGDVGLYSVQNPPGRHSRALSRRYTRNKMKSIEDFSVHTSSSISGSLSPTQSPTTSRCSTPDISKPKLKISDLVAQRFARLTKKMDEEEEKERQATEERESKKHIRRNGTRSVLGMAPGQLARVSIIEVSLSYVMPAVHNYIIQLTTTHCLLLYIMFRSL